MSSKPKTQIVQLRDVMFEQLKRLNDPDTDLEKELKRANAVTSVGAVIINSIRVENDFIRLTNPFGKKNKEPKEIGNAH